MKVAGGKLRPTGAAHPPANRALNPRAPAGRMETRAGTAMRPAGARGVLRREPVGARHSVALPTGCLHSRLWRAGRMDQPATKRREVQEAVHRVTRRASCAFTIRVCPAIRVDGNAAGESVH